jgi:hypothetical protein
MALRHVSVTVIPLMRHIHPPIHSSIHLPTNATWSWTLTTSIFSTKTRISNCQEGVVHGTNTLPPPSGNKMYTECSHTMLAPSDQATRFHTPQNHNMNLHSYEKPQISHNYKLWEVYILLFAWQCCHITDMQNKYFHNPLLFVHCISIDHLVTFNSGELKWKSKHLQNSTQKSSLYYASIQCMVF